MFRRFSDVLLTRTCASSIGNFCSTCFGGNFIIPLPSVGLNGSRSPSENSVGDSGVKLLSCASYSSSSSSSSLSSSSIFIFFIENILPFKALRTFSSYQKVILRLLKTFYQVFYLFLHFLIKLK